MLVLVFSLFPVLFCVPRLVSRVSNCHYLILIVTSLPFPFHLRLHLISRSLKKPRGSGVCVNHLKRCQTSNLLDFRYSVPLLGLDFIVLHFRFAGAVHD